MTDTMPVYQNHEQLFFRLPLYETVSISSDQLHGMFNADLRIDAYCPFCHERRVFGRNKSGWRHEDITMMATHNNTYYDLTTLYCAYVSKHELRFLLRIQQGKVSKVGQLPSFADIALDESKEYKDFLKDDDANEFHKAIGLAAHGVGIGSYVYLRRIFERLIRQRFEEFKETEKWTEEDLLKMRMDERIDLLKAHLPEFLVRNKRIYSILSLGVHELNEKQCLNFFPVLRSSIVIILEEDKRKLEELRRQQELEKAISKYQPPTSN